MRDHIELYADFNNVDEQGRVCLNTLPTLRQLESNKARLTEGMKVRLYKPRERDVWAKLVFDECWRGIPDYDTLQYYDCSPLFAQRGATLVKAEVIEYHHDETNLETTLFNLQLWFGDQPIRILGGGNGQDLVVATNARQSESYAPLSGRITCRDVSAEPHYRDIIGRPLTAVEPRSLEGYNPTGVSLRFGDTVIHAHVEFDDLFLTWGGDMPPLGSEY